MGQYAQVTSIQSKVFPMSREKSTQLRYCTCASSMYSVSINYFCLNVQTFSWYTGMQLSGLPLRALISRAHFEISFIQDIFFFILTHIDGQAYWRVKISVNSIDKAESNSNTTQQNVGR